MDDKEYAKERIKQIKLIQKDLDNLKIALKRMSASQRMKYLIHLLEMTQD